MGVFEIVRDQTFEALLTSGVPKLQAISFILIGDVADKKIDANGCLFYDVCTL